ncbi:MAG: class I SAM-dependent methyltransferase [bacterium]|nr:class I SAM-dependent methyltransferase [bacterium]
MGNPGIYDLAPYLELNWAGLSVTRARLLDETRNWYTNKLKHVDGPVCELACGYGRLLLDLARSGIPVHGTDASSERVKAAESFFDNKNISNCSFEVCAIPDAPQGDNRFHGIILAWSSIGYAVSHEDKTLLLKNIARLLVPDGLLLLDFARGSLLLRLLRYLPGLSGSLGKTGAGLKSSLRWDREEGCVLENFELKDPEGSVLRFQDRLKFLPLRKLKTLLRENGFSLQEIHGSFKGGRCYPWSRRFVISAKQDRRNDAV